MDVALTIFRHALSTAPKLENSAQVVLKPRDQQDLVRALVSHVIPYRPFIDTCHSVSFAVLGPRARSKYAALAVT